MAAERHRVPIGEGVEERRGRFNWAREIGRAERQYCSFQDTSHQGSTPIFKLDSL